MRARESAALIILGLAGCGPASPGPALPKPVATVTTSSADNAKRVDFSFADLNNNQVSTDSVHGRVTIVFFMATYDVASQAEARFVMELVRDHTPRLNAVGLVLEAPENKPLVDAFANALSLPYPLCMPGEETIRGEGPFKGINQVPSLVILDKDGRERYRHIGLEKKSETEAAVRVVEASSK